MRQRKIESEKEKRGVTCAVRKLGPNPVKIFHTIKIRDETYHYLSVSSSQTSVEEDDAVELDST